MTPLAISLILLAPSAWGQVEDSTRAVTSNAESELTEIVVTARKRVEDAQSVPESIQAIGGPLIEDAHITQIDDLGNLVSNLNIVTRGDNTPDVVMRGVGSFGVVTGVGFYADDVQLFEGQTVRTEDIERIEVLKGPQGTLYGGSNIGGAIKYITKQPTDQFDAGTSVEFGGYDERTYSGYISGPLVPGTLDARANAYYTRTDGYIYDPVLQRSVDGGDEDGGRLALLYKSDNTTAILTLNYDRTHTGAGASVYYRAQSPTDYSLEVTDGTQPNYLRGMYSITLKVDHQFGDLDLTSISSYFDSYKDRTVDVDKGPLPLLTNYHWDKIDVESQELRLSNSGAGPLKWLVGLYVQGDNPSDYSSTLSFNGDHSNPANFNNPALFSWLTTDTRQRHREYAAFGDATYDLRQWTFEVGVRADYNNSSLDDPVWGIAGGQHGTEVTPKVSVSYHFNGDVMGYATISRGFEPGDLLEQTDASGKQYVAPYKPETTWNYELGLKSTLLDRIRLNAAVFYLDYQDRLYQTVAFESNQFIQVTENIGPSHNYGGEFDVSTKLTRELLFTTSFGATKAVWGNTPYYDQDLNQPTNLNGRLAPFTPAYQGSVSLDWSHHLTDNLIFGARADATFIGRSYWDPTDHFYQPAYQLANFGIRLEGARWSVNAHVSNAFDHLYNTEYISAAELQAPFNVAGIARPRLWTVALKYHW